MKPEKKMGMATRDAYGQALVEVGKANPNVVVLDADVSGSTKSRTFAKEFPDRFFNFGIAEANMVSAAAGFASCGKIPFVSSFAAFLMCKSFEQLRMSVANPHLNVKICGSHSGISLGEDGASQMAVEDIALALALPKFVVLVPADEMATRALVKQAAKYMGPVYLRTSRPPSPLLYSEGEDFTIGHAKILPRDLLTQDQCVDVVRPFIGIHRFQIGQMPHGLVLGQDAVGPQEASSLPGDVGRHVHVVALGE